MGIAKTIEDHKNYSVTNKYDWEGKIEKDPTWSDMVEELPGGIKDIKDEYTHAAEKYVHFVGDPKDQLDSPKVYQEIETKFLDELYGSDGDPTTDGAIAEGLTDWNGGLALRRVHDDSLEIGSIEYYDHITKGDVDWANYQNDTLFQKAFEDLGYDLSVLGQDEAESAKQVRHAQSTIGLKKLHKADSDSWKMHWEGQYQANDIYRTEDGSLYMANAEGEIERQKTIVEMLKSGEGRLEVNQPGDHDEIVGPSREITRPDIPGVTWTDTGKGWDRPSLTNPTKPKYPTNLPPGGGGKPGAPIKPTGGKE